MKHRDSLSTFLQIYADRRTLDFHRYSEYHMRLMDGGFIVLDLWTTRKYYVLQTDYYKLTDKHVIERGGEKGFIPPNSRLESWLDKLFFAADYL